jgi:single-stranded DNA-binding protein
MEERARRVGLENRVASHRRLEQLGRARRALLHQGDHVLVEGTLVSSSYEREYGKGKKATTVKHTVWQIRADSIRKLNRGEKEPEAVTPGSDSPAQPSADAPF